MKTATVIRKYDLKSGDIVEINWVGTHAIGVIIGRARRIMNEPAYKVMLLDSSGDICNKALSQCKTLCSFDPMRL